MVCFAPGRRSKKEKKEEDDESDNEENMVQLFGKRKSYSPRKNKFSLEQKGVRMLQTPVSYLNGLHHRDRF